VFGDGACGSGALHETLNVAALWKLPLLLVVDNNGYAVSTSVEKGLAPASLTDFAAPFRVPAAVVDGTDIDAVVAAMEESTAAIRAGGGPRFLEMRCTRMGAHSTLTKEERPTEEVERFKAFDPLRIYETRLRSRGVLDDAGWARVQAEVQAEMAGAERFAADASWPDPEEALLDA
jgi:pyruvate dehydrogenase E1 component alpha subunit